MRIALRVRGIVQGVGFRPFVHRTARARGLSGWVKNGRSGVRIEVQGDEASVAAFAWSLEHELPAAASIDSIERERLDEREEQSESAFEILASDGGTEPALAVLPPDLATCAACWADIQTSSDRRHAYPFTNCTACGPRYSIVCALPYDRPRTTMAGFPMCADCAREYDDVTDRRHHAQPVACPRCGPELAWMAGDGKVLARRADALREAAAAIRRGAIVALRGLGGFQLVCDGTRGDVVATLRARKRRPDKPFAVMFAGVAELEKSAEVSASERAMLTSPTAPIVLVRVRAGGVDDIAEEVAPGCTEIGAMLPNTPLHGLLLDAVGRPIVCTSGNRSEEPIAIDTDEAIARLAGIADGFLTHDRPIERPLDDSVVRIVSERAAIIRRARGYAPRSVARIDPAVTVLAVGAHLKSTVTLGHHGVLVPSQHLGDLGSLATRELLRRTVDDLLAFFDARPGVVACDRHPDYASTVLAEELAERFGARLLRVQHHHAHVAAVLAEHALGSAHVHAHARSLARPVLGLAWDGSGLGTDGTIWGGEALVCRGAAFERFAHLRPFPLVGGDRAARDPRRCALGVLADVRPEELEATARRWFGTDASLHVAALRGGIHATRCSSLGRLFDAIGAIAGITAISTYEGQTACALERLAALAEPDGAYPFPLHPPATDGAPCVADTKPLVDSVVADVRREVPAAQISRRFHEALIALGVAMARRAGIADVVLAGGCFQNRLLAEGLESQLERAGFRVRVASEIPTNDGGISVGQAWLATTPSV